MIKYYVFLTTVGLLFCSSLLSQEKSNFITTDDNLIRTLVVIDPFSDSRTGPEKLTGPSKLNNSGLNEIFNKMECDLVETVEIEMPGKWKRQYGEWNRASLTNNVLNKAISQYDEGEVFVLGLLSGNKSVTGMLAGLQHMGPNRQPLKDSRGKDIIGLPRLGDSKPLKVGLLWIHSEAAFNTPDITIEGDMGGMNVAVAAGYSNTALRLQAGLDPPISTKHIVMLGAWDTDPYEENLIDNSFLTVLHIDNLMDRNNEILKEVKRISSLVDVIYVHVDLSILDRVGIMELCATIQNVFVEPKTAAIGIASCPENPGKKVLNDANMVVKSALQGIKSRK